MRVGLSHSPVGRPASVAEGGVTGGQGRHRLADLASVLFNQQLREVLPVLPRCNAPRVVAAVLELFQAGEHQLRRFVVGADVAEYSAHMWCVLLSSRRSTRDERMQRTTPHALMGRDTSGRFCVRQLPAWFVPPVSTVLAGGHPPSLPRSPSS